MSEPHNPYDAAESDDMELMPESSFYKTMLKDRILSLSWDELSGAIVFVGAKLVNQSVSRFLYEHPYDELTMTEISKSLGLSTGKTLHYLERGMEAGVIGRKGDRYGITIKGSDVITCLLEWGAKWDCASTADLKFPDCDLCYDGAIAIDSSDQVWTRCEKKDLIVLKILRKNGVVCPETRYEELYRFAVDAQNLSGMKVHHAELSVSKLSRMLYVSRKTSEKILRELRNKRYLQSLKSGIRGIESYPANKDRWIRGRKAKGN